MSVEFRLAENDDMLRKTASLADTIWHECFTDIISTEQIDYMVNKFQSFEAMKKQTAEHGYRYFDAYHDNELCGYFVVKPETDDRFFLSKLYLHKKYRGKGIASLILKKVFEEAYSAGKKKVYLTVNKHNYQAIEVYKKTGFIVSDKVVTDIGNGYVMDDYIMEYILTEIE